MNIKNILSAMTVATMLTACGGNTVTHTYQETAEAFRNPMKGLREYFCPGEDPVRPEYPEPYGSMIKEYMQWNMIEDDPTDGVDKIIAYCNERWKGVEDINMKVIPRVFLVWVEPWHGGRPKDPNNPHDMNGQHWPKGIPPQTGPYKQIPGSVGAYVDEKDKLTPIIGGYFDPAFPGRVEKLVEKLGQAWDNDPRVAYVEMGIIGEWGEHHDPDLSTYWPPHDEPEHVDNRTWIPGMEKTLGDAFSKAFKNKKVMVRYAYEFKDYEFGIYWDSWSQPQEIVRGYQEMRKLGDRWKTQPIGGEITWNWGDLARFRSFEQVVADAPTRDYTIEQIRNLHCNHLGGITWANFNDPEFKPNAAILQKALGYRFVLTQATYPKRADKEIDLAFTVVNTGSSPFYYNWPVEVALLDANTHQKVWAQTLDKVNISQWMPGDNWSIEQQKYVVPAEANNVHARLALDPNIPQGKYILAVSILDPAGMKPSLRLANKNYFDGGYHPLGYIGVGTNISETAIPATLYQDITEDKSLRYELPVPVILDTDVGNDIDDVLAMQMLFNYEDEGLIDLLGITISKSNPYSIEYIDAYCRLNGRPDMPLGFAYNGVNSEDGGYLRQTLDTIIDGKKILHPQRTIKSNLPEGYKLLRKMLASQADSSVVFVAVGPETNLARLLKSSPDEFSPLNGKALVAKKVKLLSVMAGLFGNEFDFPEWNVMQDLDATRTVFANWPTPLIASGWELGNKLLYPHQSILNDFPNSYKHPLCVSYKVYDKMPYDRQTWDLTSVLQAIEPGQNYFTLSPAGKITIDKDGKSLFAPDAKGKHRYLLIEGEENIRRTLEAIVYRVTQ
ncbi:nucleoside hydrolase [Bacteroides sp. OttesenSCG-928-D19]|nr:nucleoside hydrolase [Bacteroides sp. OttesenSCG-928-D19]